jgi:hypothetical protein
MHPPIPYLPDEERRVLDVVGKVTDGETVEFITCVNLGVGLGAETTSFSLVSFSIFSFIDMEIVNNVLRIKKRDGIKGVSCT